jgi:hypothetical protein
MVSDETGPPFIAVRKCHAGWTKPRRYGTKPRLLRSKARHANHMDLDRQVHEIGAARAPRLWPRPSRAHKNPSRLPPPYRQDQSALCMVMLPVQARSTDWGAVGGPVQTLKAAKGAEYLHVRFGHGDAGRRSARARAERRVGELQRKCPKAVPLGSNQHQDVSRPTHFLNPCPSSASPIGSLAKLAEVPEDTEQARMSASVPALVVMDRDFPDPGRHAGEEKF